MKTVEKLQQNDYAITPVIGIILMIAIVVVLGAIISSYGLSLSGLLTHTYIVGTTAKQMTDDTIEVDFVGGKDADKLLYLNVSVNSHYYNSGGNWSPTQGNTFNGDGTTPIQVGHFVTITDSINITSAPNHVIVVAQFTDGAKHVVLNTWV